MSTVSGTICKQLIFYGQILPRSLSSFCLLCEVKLGFLLENEQRFRLPLYPFRFSSLSATKSHTRMGIIKDRCRVWGRESRREN